MPVEVKFLDNRVGVLVVAKGVVTGEELINTVSGTTRSDEELKKIKYILIDFTQIESVKISSMEVKIIAENNIKTSKIAPHRVVAFAAEKDIIFGFSRMWQVFADKTSWETIVMRSRTDAEAWIKERIKEKFNLEIAFA